MDQLEPLNLLITGTLAGMIVPLLSYLTVKRFSEAVDKPLLTWAGLGLFKPDRAGVRPVSVAPAAIGKTESGGI